MTSNRLTKEEGLLLQRHADGEANGQEAREAAELLKASAAARIYVSTLEALGEAVRMGTAAAWAAADLPSAEELAALAGESATLLEAPLEDLAPMLERFHDGETDPAEAAVVVALMAEREDVASYLAELEGLSTGLRGALGVDEVSFDGFWEGIAEAIDDAPAQATGPVVIETFDTDLHRELLHRYHDGEVTAAERRCVEAWLEGEESGVENFLGALAEVHLGVSAAIEVATETADLDGTWEAIQDRLTAIDAEQAADNVVAFDAAPAAKSAPRSTWHKPLLAMAAAVALLVTGSLIGNQIWELSAEDSEQRTVVIFDSIESAPGSSVMLHAPQLAGFEMGDGMGQGVDRVFGDDEDEPTVLWLFDSNGNDEDEEEDELPGPI